MLLFAIPNMAAATELTTAYQSNSAPKYIVTQAGNVEGLCMDILRKVEDRLENIKFKGSMSIPLKRLESYLETGEIDVFFGLAKNSKREMKFTYVDTPLYEVNHVVAVRKGEYEDISGFQFIEALGTKGKILTNFGSATERFLRRKQNLNIDSSGRDLKINLNKLLKKRGEFVYFHDLGLYKALAEEFKRKPIEIRKLSFHKYHHYIAFTKDTDSEIIARVSQVMTELQADGTLLKILMKYKRHNPTG